MCLMPLRSTTADNIFVMSDTIVALDLGTTHVRAIEARIQKGKLPVILKTHSINIDTPFMESGLITNPEILVDLLVRLWKEGKFASKKVYSMGTGESYDTQVVDNLPWSPDEDFKRMLPYHIRDSFSFEIEDYYFDAYTLNEYYKLDSPDPQRYKKVLAVGVTKNYANTLIECLEKAKLIPIGIDIMPFTLIRAYYAAPREDEIPNNAIIVNVDLGGDVTTIVIHQNAQPIYINMATPMGGRHITESIAKETQMMTQEAEMIKRSFAMSEEDRLEAETQIVFDDGSTRRTRLADLPDVTLELAQNVIAKQVSNLITHIHEILEDAFSTHPGKPFEIVFSGGGAELVTLKERAQSELQIPVSLLQPFSDKNSKKLKSDIINHQNKYIAIYGLLVGLNNE